MRLTGFHGQIDAVEDRDLGGFRGFDADVQVFDFQSGHEACCLFCDFQFVFDGGGQAIAEVGHRDLGDDLAEEAADHQPAGLFLRDAAGAQVEQLLVVETPGGAGVSGADDLAGLDLQVGHRVGARAVGEHQVAVHLEGVGAGGLGADQHVADPDGVRVGQRRIRIPLQRTLIQARWTCSWAGRGRPATAIRGAGRHRRSTGPATRRPRPGRRTARWPPSAPPRRPA